MKKNCVFCSNAFIKKRTVEKTNNFLLKKMKKKIMIKDKSIKGFNLGVNLGKLSGQTILHCHFHLIPRRKNDRDLRLNKGGFFWIK